MSQKPKISVVVPCRGHALELTNCLAALANQTVSAPYEIIVVDSASDPAVVAAAQTFDGVRVVSSATPLFSEPARNFGVTAALGEILAFTDADCIPASNWLAAAYDALDEGAAMAGGPVGDALPWHPIAITDNVLQFAELSPHRPAQPAHYFPGCNIAMTRAVFDQLGGFPETGSATVGDVLFTSAAAARWPGWVRFVPEMRVDHLGRKTIPAMWRHMYAFGYDRARVDTRMKPIYRRLGRYSIMFPAICAKRWVHIARQSARWHPAGLLRLFILTPLMFIGLLAGAVGFRDGCREPFVNPPAAEARA